jgi:predicted membrane protein
MLHREGYLQMFFSQQFEYEWCKTMVIAVCYIYYSILLFIKQEGSGERPGLLHSREEPREDGNKKEPFAGMKGRNNFISTDERYIHESYNNFSQSSSSQRSVAV